MSKKLKDEEQDTSTEEATEDVDTETTDDQEEVEAEDSTSTEQTDYKAIAEAERERADKLQKAFAEREYKERTRKRAEETDEETEDDEDKPLTMRELRAHEARIVARTQKEVQESRALDVARAHTSSEEEARAAHIYWKNRVVPTGDLESDMLFAIGGLNHKQNVAKNLELARALKGKDATIRDYTGTQRDTPEGSAPKLKAELQNSLKRSGFVFDTKLKVWKKETSKGKFVYKDLRTGKIQPLKS